MTKDKYIIIKDETDNKAHIVLANKTQFTNDWNKFKYLNNKRKRTIQLHTRKRNWKEISQACLNDIELPENITTFSEIDYKDLTFNFLTNTGQTITIPLMHGKDADVNTILSENFNPSFFRTNFPKGLIGSYLADFVTVVLYELYKNASILDKLVESAVLPSNFITVDGTNWYFDVASIEHNRLDISVSDEMGNPVSIDDNYFNIEQSIHVGYHTYISTEYGEKISNDEQDNKHIQSYRVKDNTISLLFEDNSFKLEQQKKVLIIEINYNDTKVSLIRFLSMNIEKQGLIGKLRDDWTVEIPLINAIPEQDILLSATITDPDGLTHNGNINFYLEGGE